MKNKFAVGLISAAFALAIWGCGSNNEETIPAENVVAEVTSIEETQDKSDEASNISLEENKGKEEEEESIVQIGEEVEVEDGVEKKDEPNWIITPIEPEATMYLTTSVNIRKGPATTYEKVGHGEMNQEVVVVGRDSEGWYEIKYNGDVAFVSDKYISDKITEMPSFDSEIEVLNQNGGQQTQVAPTAAPENSKALDAAPVKAPAGVLFIGDSRCVQMREALAGGGCSWVCKNGARYEWFEETAIPQADAMVGKGTKVVICMGVNDPGDVGKYAALTNAKAIEWAARGAKTYYVSVNPVWENPYTSEEQVKAFNASIVGQLMGVKYIDTHSYLMGAGYKLIDGLHYDGPTYFNIFNAIIGSL